MDRSSGVLGRLCHAAAVVTLAMVTMLAAPRASWASADPVATGTTPVAVAVNPATNKTYILNQGSNSVTVVDGATRATRTVNVGAGPVALAINLATNRIYVANGAGHNISILNGASDTVIATIELANGSAPQAIAVDPASNIVYVANSGKNSVSAINAATNVISKTAAVGKKPSALVINPATGRLYVANTDSRSVTVLRIPDLTLVQTVTTGLSSPTSLAINVGKKKVYVVSAGSRSLYVLESKSKDEESKQITFDDVLTGVAVNVATDRVYVARMPNRLLIRRSDGDSDSSSGNTSSIDLGAAPSAVAVNPVTNQVFVAVPTGVAIVDGKDRKLVTTAATGSAARALAVNPVTNVVVTANAASAGASWIDVDTETVSKVTLDKATVFTAGGRTLNGIAVNPATNKVYVSDSSGTTGTLSVFDGGSLARTTVAAGNGAGAIAVNPIANKIFVANRTANTVTIVNGATGSIAASVAATLATGAAPSAAVVNPLTGRAYVMNQTGNSLTVVEGRTNTLVTPTSTVAVGTSPQALAINEATNRVYVANGGSNSVSVVDGDTLTVTAIAVGANPMGIVVNTATDRAYVANQGGNSVSIIDTTTNAVLSTVAILKPTGAMALNRMTNTIYVGTEAPAGKGTVVVINGATGQAGVSLPVDAPPNSLAVNTARNLVYVAAPAKPLTIFQGATSTSGGVPGSASILVASTHRVAFNPATNTAFDIYLEGVDARLSAIPDLSIQSDHIRPAIAALTGNVVLSPSQSFTVAATSSSNYNRTIRDVFFQIDTTSGAWTQAPPKSSSSWLSELASLKPGVHVLYIFATDQDATADKPGEGSSPIVSPTAAYVFGVGAQPIITNVSPASGPLGGGTPITITGSNFGPKATVTINNVAATSVVVKSTTSITAVTPPGVTGAAVVGVTNQVGRTGSGTFTYGGCSLVLSPRGANPTSAGAIGAQFSVTTQAGCNWTAVSNNGFITITGGSEGTGNGTVSYSVASTAGPLREGTITVKVTFTISGQSQDVTQTFSVTQGPCVFTLAPTSRQIAAGDGIDAGVALTTSPGCAWSATAGGVPWLTPVASGVGSSAISFTFTRNDTGAIRTATLTVQDKSVLITQPPSTASTDRDDGAADAVISGNGRHIAFATLDTVPVSNGDTDTNGVSDIYVLDRLTARVARVSVGAGGAEGDNASSEPAISVNGRFVAFRSAATNLVTGDTNGFDDVFLRDRDTDGNGVFDEPNGSTTILISQTRTGVRAQGGHSFAPSIGGNGKLRVFIAFTSEATNLAGSDQNAASDVFLATRRVVRSGGNSFTQDVGFRRVSETASGTGANASSAHPALSPDARFVAFDSAATNLVAGDANGVVDVFVRKLEDDGELGAPVRVSVRGNGQENGNSTEPAVADSGLTVFTSAAALVSTDTNGTTDIYSRAVDGGTTVLVSVTSTGQPALGRSFAPVVSENGRFVAFASDAANLSGKDNNTTTDVFVRDRNSNSVRLVSLPPGDGSINSSSDPSLSRDGQTIVYSTTQVVAPVNGEGSVIAAENRPVVKVDSPSPANMKFSPNHGPAHTPIDVQITGTNLVGAIVRFGGVAVPTRPIDQTALAVTAPDRDPGTVNISIEVGAIFVDLGPFTFDAPTAPACGFTVSAPNTTSASAASTIEGTVMTETGCQWSAATEVDWLTVEGPKPASGSGTFTVKVEENTNATPRSAEVVVNGQGLLSIVQRGTGCAGPAVTVNQGSREVDAAAGSISGDMTIAIEDSCSWTATAEPDWLHASGTVGGGALKYDFDENTAPGSRVGFVRVVDKDNRTNTVTVVQRGVGPQCTFTVNTPDLSVSSSGRPLTFSVFPSSESCSWTATIGPSDGWIRTADGSAITAPIMRMGTGEITFGIQRNQSLARQGTIVVADRPSTVNQAAAEEQFPLGFVEPFATNVPGGAISGSVALTGWAVDNQGLVADDVVNRTTAIEIYRQVVPGEFRRKPDGQLDLDDQGSPQLAGTACQLFDPASPNCLLVGYANRVSGARPDIQQLFPGVPESGRAGWGYLLLTNFLPDTDAAGRFRSDSGGNGTFNLLFYARDAEKDQFELNPAGFPIRVTRPAKTLLCRDPSLAPEQKTIENCRIPITAQNATATDPFGSIDNPSQGGEVSGTILHAGWTLTPPGKFIPADGSTIGIFVDGNRLEAPTYGVPRIDVEQLFPGFANSTAAGAQLLLNTTQLSDGVHTIAWAVTDSESKGSGIGSRFFTVRNVQSSQAVSTGGESAVSAMAVEGVTSLRVAGSEVRFSLGTDGAWQPSRADRQGTRHVVVTALGIVRLTLDRPTGAHFEGYTVGASTLEALPIGSTFDAAAGTFAWQLGPGFVGVYDLLFVRTAGGVRERIPVRVVVEPQGGDEGGLSVESASAGGGVNTPFTVEGLAMNGAARQLHDVAVYAYPTPDAVTGSQLSLLGPPLVGSAKLPAMGADAAEPFGGLFARSRYAVSIEGLKPGAYDLLIVGRSRVSSDLDATAWVRGVVVR